MFKVLNSRTSVVLSLGSFKISAFKNPTGGLDTGRLTHKQNDCTYQPPPSKFVLRALYMLSEVGALTHYMLLNNGPRFLISTQNSEG